MEPPGHQAGYDTRAEDQGEEQKDQQQPQAREISKEDAERMLNAIQQQEKDVKDKVDKKKAAAAKGKTKNFEAWVINSSYP